MKTSGRYTCVAVGANVGVGVEIVEAAGVYTSSGIPSQAIRTSVTSRNPSTINGIFLIS